MKICKEVKIRKDKSDRTTKDKVLDKKTISILDKLIIRNKIIELQGSICTGKEANVYMGLASTELYSKYIKNIHVLNEKEKNIFCTSKLLEMLKLAGENGVETVLNQIKNNDVITVSKRKLRKKLKKNKDSLINSSTFLNLRKKSADIKDNLSLKITENTIDTNFSFSDDFKVEEFVENKIQDNHISVAIKIYKTSAMSFKDRERYLEGEKRFKNFCTKNSRKLIKLWAEKEVRNLKRLNKNNIPSPIPIYLKRNILIMSLIGEPASKLKDAYIEDVDDCYNQVIKIIDEMYNKCNLIHADMSEYNLLYFKNIVYVIDVGQSVEKDHINATEFLISDLININNFFKKIGANTHHLNDLFVHITKFDIPEYLKDFDLNKKTFIPNKLDDIANLEDINIFTGKNQDEEHFIVENNINENLNLADEKQLSKKDKKKLVKEFNRERRAYKISKIEKHRIFKKYVGRKKKK